MPVEIPRHLADPEPGVTLRNGVSARPRDPSHEAGARERTMLNELESVQAAQVSLDSPAQQEA